MYASGFEYNADRELVATVWVDGIPEHYQYNPDYDGVSQAIGIYAYGDDVYVLTTEFEQTLHDMMTHVWLNGKILMSYQDIQPTGFIVL